MRKYVIPTPRYDENTDKLIAQYERAYNTMLDRFQEQFKNATNMNEYKKCLATADILKDYEMAIKELNKEVAPEVIKLVTNAFRNGMANFGFFVNKFSRDSQDKEKKYELKLPKNMIRAMSEDTFSELLRATAYMNRKTKKLVRDTVSDVIRYHQALNDGREAMVKDIYERLTAEGLSKSFKEDGFVGIVDKRGRRWNLKTYAEMVATTKIQQAHVQATKYEGEEWGVDLAIISHPACKDSCNKWRDVIVSINGKTEGFITYDEARRSKEVFHPNCHGTLMPVRKLSNVPKDILEKNLKSNAPNKDAVNDLLKSEKLTQDEKNRKIAEKRKEKVSQ